MTAVDRRDDLLIVIGSNVEPETHLPACASLLARSGSLVDVSRVYASPAWEGGGAADYLNAAVRLETTLSPKRFCEEVVPAIERELGERREVDSQGRVRRRIDVDLALVGEQVLRVGHRAIPAEDVVNRPYFAVPLAEIAPDLRHPVDGRTLAEIAASFADATLAPCPHVRLASSERVSPG